MSNLLAATGHEIRMYDMTQPKPRPPLYSEFFDLTFPAALYPAEVALVLSFAALPLPGVDQRRRRGRVYIGPIGVNAQTGGGSDIRPEPAAQIAFKDAGVRLASYTSTATWIVWSELNGTGADVKTVFCDNAFDTQRRRGAAATGRISGAVSQV
jgi:hypothetical protein